MVSSGSGTKAKPTSVSWVDQQVGNVNVVYTDGGGGEHMYAGNKLRGVYNLTSRWNQDEYMYL